MPEVRHRLRQKTAPETTAARRYVHLDEVFIRIRGVLHYLWRAVDQHGVVLDILCRIGEMARLPSASSSASCIGYDTSRGGSSQTACAAMVLVNELSCPMCVIGQADT